MDCNFDVYIAFLFVSEFAFHKRNINERLLDLKFVILSKKSSSKEKEKLQSSPKD